MIPSGNPFAFPGMPGAGPSFDPGAANPVMQSLDMMRQVWGNLGSMASAAPGGNVPGLDELDKRITDLRAIENWLNLNLTMLRGTIQGLEVQRATISTLRNFAQNVSSAYQAHTPSGASDTDASDLPPPSPLEIVLGLRKAPGAAADASPFGFPANATPPAEAAAAAAPAPQPTGWPHMPAHMPPSASIPTPPMPAAMQPPSPQPAAPSQPPTPPSADAAPAGDSTGAPAGSPQANAWWSMLQDQFNKITTAASQAVPAVPAMPHIPQMPTMPHMDLAKAAAAAARTVFEPSRAPDAPARKAAPAERTSPPARKTSSGRNGAASTSSASRPPASKAPAKKAAGKTAAKRAPAASKAPARKAPARGARGKA
jgi:hypothetical protein